MEKPLIDFWLGHKTRRALVLPLIMALEEISVIRTVSFESQPRTSCDLVIVWGDKAKRGSDEDRETDVEFLLDRYPGKVLWLLTEGQTGLVHPRLKVIPATTSKEEVLKIISEMTESN